jgi:putative ABC transport system ATP-binding protein
VAFSNTNIYMIRLHNIVKDYRSDAVENRALDEVNLTINNGEFVSIMGPSGCGKSTLLNIIGLLDDFDSGLYVFNNQDTAQLNEKEKVRLRKAKVGFVFQNFNLLDDLTVYENIELPLVYMGMKSAQRLETVEKTLEEISMAHRRHHYPYQLSGGQQQRVAVGRAIVTRPELLLADEPTGNLDTAHGNEIMEMLTRLNEQGTTIIMVTHSLHDAAYSQRIVKLLDGRVAAEKRLQHA